MIRLQFELDLEYTVLTPSADFFFYIHAANTQQQKVLGEAMHITQPEARWHVMQEGRSPNQRCLRVNALEGPLHVQYIATVQIAHHLDEPSRIAETPLQQLPQDVLQYIYPSRYCQSDLLSGFALREFGDMPPGYLRAKAVCDWVGQHVEFRSNSSDSSTSVHDTLVERVGVCRDFAHLMIALCRALNMPARIATGTDYGADPTLGPPDFHAYVEVFLGHRWYLFDPSGVAIPMGMLRLATGRDAADVAFATIFGGVTCMQPRIKVEALHDPLRKLEMPAHSPYALSTDSVLASSLIQESTQENKPFVPWSLAGGMPLLRHTEHPL